MNIQFHIQGLNNDFDLRRRLLQLLASMHSLISITAVSVVLEHRTAHAPRFRAFVLLACPDQTAIPKPATIRWKRPGLKLRLTSEKNRAAKKSAEGATQKRSPVARRSWRLGEKDSDNANVNFRLDADASIQPCQFIAK
jgi:hypothetical protein